MRLLLINPNTTDAVTRHVAAQAALYGPATLQIIASTARSGVPVVATPEAFALAAEAAQDCLAQAAPGSFDAVLLACFGDPGLEALQCRSRVPVVGLAQACLHRAEEAGVPYAIVTAGAAWEGMLTQRFADWGASALFRGVEVLQGHGLQVLADPAAALPAVVEAISRARQRGAQRFILGGAVFAGYRRVMAAGAAPADGVMDCVQCAMHSVAGIIRS